MVKKRSHETLVTAFADWLEDHNLIPAYNQAVDLGIEDPPVLIEVKAIRKWSTSIREAVGQLYEYRYFEVGPKNPNLIFLASEPVPQKWIKYLETDREIGVAWRSDEGFDLSRLARRHLGSRPPRRR